MNRRNFLKGLAALVAIPSVAKAKQTIDLGSPAVVELDKPVEKVTIGMEIKRKPDGLIREIHVSNAFAKQHQGIPPIPKRGA